MSDRPIGNVAPDRLDGPSASDRIEGGGGDLVDCAAENTTRGVAVDLLAGKAIDGDGDVDVLGGVENVTTGRGADTAMGDAAANGRAGGAGNDRLTDRPGADRFGI